MSKNSGNFYLHAKKSLGQNFLANDLIVHGIIGEIEEFLTLKNISEANVLEIGPGTGALTKELLNSSVIHSVTAIEKDHRAIKGLQETLCKEFPTQFILHDTDILKFEPTQFNMCIGNIPYYITSDILMWLCAHKKNFQGAIFMVQDEVADRLCAQTNTKEYSRLTIKMQLNFEIVKLFHVPKECFVPQPKVNSAVVLFIPKVFQFKNAKEEKEFETFTTLLFSQRRKMLRRILSDSFKNISEEQLNEFWLTLKELNIVETDRPESISPISMLELFHIFRQTSSVFYLGS